MKNNKYKTDDFLNADKRMTDARLQDLADRLTIDELPTRRESELMDGIAEGIKRMMDDQDFERWSNMRSQHEHS